MHYYSVFFLALCGDVLLDLFLLRIKANFAILPLFSLIWTFIVLLTEIKSFRETADDKLVKKLKQSEKDVINLLINNKEYLKEIINKDNNDANI
jgi:uncharacterized protein YybS (DUF2232 family)